MERIKSSRKWSFWVIGAVYLAAAALGTWVFIGWTGALLWRLLAADTAATLLVWAAGVLLRNSSVYDPYWSVAPMAVIPALVFYLDAVNTGTVLLMAVILFWGVRLTLNWAHTFHSLNVQDWRYSRFRSAYPRAWFLINLFGIHLFPTLVVFLAMIPAVLFITAYSAVNSWMVLSLMLCVAAVALEIAADAQMHRFRDDAANRGRFLDDGLWKHMRHPNYLGEILMWWGVFLVLLSADPSRWTAGAGALVNTFMFLTVSIPMMEKRLMETKPGYAQYRARTGMLLPRLFRNAG